MRGGVVIGSVENDVGIVRLPLTCHRYAQVPLRRGEFNQHICGVGSEALDTVGGNGVAEGDVLGHVVGGQGDAVAEPDTGSTDRDRPIIARGGDGSSLTVMDLAVSVV